jgi:short-subunit dehydrogenase
MHQAYRTALVTGASSGIGEQIARQLAAAGCDLVLVARRQDRLAGLAASLADQHGTGAEVLAADLTTEAGLRAAGERLADPGRPVELLVNNAGVGSSGRFGQTAAATEQTQIQLNVLALVRLTHAALPPMMERGYGGVLNVSSVAGYVLMPGSSTYAATKAFVTSFSGSLHAEVSGCGVHVTALCPGFTRTEFHQAGPDEGSSIPGFAWQDAAGVARAGLAAVSAGRAVCVPGPLYKTAIGLSRVIPRSAVRAAVRAARRF